MLSQNFVGWITVQPPRGQEAKSIVAWILVVLAEDGTPGQSGVGNIIRPSVDAVAIRRREIGVGDEHHRPAILGAKMASVGRLTGGTLNDDNHSGSPLDQPVMPACQGMPDRSFRLHGSSSKGPMFVLIPCAIAAEP